MTAVADRDHTVPGLAVAMSRETLMEVLAGHLPECRDGAAIVDLRVVDVQYTPGAHAQVLWKLHLQDQANGRTGRQLIFVKALRRDDPAPAEPQALIRRYAAIRAQRGMDRELPLRTPWLFVPAAKILVHAFPLDPLLPQLLDAVDPQAMKAALHRAWQPRQVRVRRVRCETLAYTPEARAAVRYEVLSEHKETCLPEIRRLVGKLDVKRSPSRLFAGHWAVWRASVGRVSIAPPAGYVSAARLSLQELVNGTRLTDVAERGTFIGLVRETARAIAHVHSLQLPLLTVRDVEKEMRTVDRWIDVLTRLRPSQAARLAVIGPRLRRELADRLRITGAVHGDFHLANVMADEHGITIIDWDQVAHGDPMVDVGRVLASLRVSSLRVHGTIDGFADVEEHFLRNYLAATGDDERRVRLFEAVALLVAAAAPFRLQRDGWEQGAELMLDEVARTLELSTAGARIAGTPRDVTPAIAFAERVRWAVDRPYAQALLVPIVHETYGADIEVTECTPQVAELRRSRLHVRWVVKGYRGKQRWRGSLDGAGFRDDSGRGRLRRLHLAAGETARHPDALQLPRVAGHLAPLSMIVFAPPAGEPLTRILGTQREGEAIRALAGALAAFHALPIDTGKERSTARDLRSTRIRVDRLADLQPLAARSVRSVFARVEARLAAIGERRAPTPIGLSLAAVRINGSAAGVSLAEDVRAAEPLMVVGDLLAQLTIQAMERDEAPAAAVLLRRAYADAAGCSDDELRQFETLRLLARACRLAAKTPSDPVVARIIAGRG